MQRKKGLGLLLTEQQSKSDSTPQDKQSTLEDLAQMMIKSHRKKAKKNE